VNTFHHLYTVPSLYLQIVYKNIECICVKLIVPIHIVIYGVLCICQGTFRPQIKAKFCGRGQPIDYYSGSNYVQVTFQSNAAMAGKGFKLRYSFEGILV